MDKLLAWEIMYNADRTVWVAFNKEKLTAHLLQDASQDVFDPDPSIPQHVFEEFLKQKTDMYT